MIRLSLILLFAVPLLAGTPGTFRGVLGEVADRGPGWVFVRSANDKFRIVNIVDATVSYADEVPLAGRKKVPARSLVPGTEVRVTAEQDERSGDWHATEIEILRLAQDKPRPPAHKRHQTRAAGKPQTTRL